MAIFKYMKLVVCLVLSSLFHVCLKAQAQEWNPMVLQEKPVVDELVYDTIPKYDLQEIVIDLAQEEYKKEMIVLRNRLRRVYPYARATAENLLILNENLNKLDKKNDQRKYIKRSQKYLEGQFKDKLKKLSRNDGKILLKLIDRQTGQTAFTLIKEFKSGWTAFWSNATAKSFSLDLKSEYRPYEDIQDFFLETQLQFLFFSYQLEYSPGTPAIDYTKLLEHWQSKAEQMSFFPIELQQ